MCVYKIVFLFKKIKTGVTAYQALSFVGLSFTVCVIVPTPPVLFPIPPKEKLNTAGQPSAVIGRGRLVMEMPCVAKGSILESLWQAARRGVARRGVARRGVA